jgi:hypothetical protein
MSVPSLEVAAGCGVLREPELATERRDAIAVLELIAAIEAKAAGHSLDTGEKRRAA